MGRNLAKTYDPKSFEDRIYEMWEEHGSFNAEVIIGKAQMWMLWY